MNEWQPVSTAPERQWIRTRLTGEDGENICAKETMPWGEVDWAERNYPYRTTGTHHSFAAPDQWAPL